MALQRQSRDPVSLAGDPAGANLALAIFQQAHDREIPLPGRIVLISPWLDMTLSGESYMTRAEADIFSTPSALKAMARS